ncbi:MAG: sun protein [Deltaproteobacteria bacterium]|nr:sun protein [Deltaproteobacteria bacterium]
MRKPLPGSCDQARLMALELLQQIERSSSFADEALDRAFLAAPELRPIDRSFVHELVMGVLRWRGRLDWIIQQVLKSPGKKIDPRVKDILRLGVYQLYHLDRVPPSAAVNESVRLAKSILGDEKISGFVNAALRTILRRKEEFVFPSIEKEPLGYLTAFLSHPRWLANRWLQEFGGETAARICLANNFPPPWTLRVNDLKTSRKKLSTDLKNLGILTWPTPFSPTGLVAGKNPLTEGGDLFQRGLFFLQDEASQIVSHVLQPQPGERILDACAAPGGKATHIAELMENRGEVYALDLHEKKLGLITENAQRLGLSIIKSLTKDASQPFPLDLRSPFDRILVDAPCTGLGILHRNPEAKWRRKEDDPRRLQPMQLALLQNVSSYLKPGGVLVYSTCTLTTEENDQVIDRFLTKNTDFIWEDLHSRFPPSWHKLLDERGFYRTYPAVMIQEDGYRMDGFFAARMRKR